MLTVSLRFGITEESVTPRLTRVLKASGLRRYAPCPCDFHRAGPAGCAYAQTENRHGEQAIARTLSFTCQTRQ
jgi:hypothetical protein